MKRGAFLLFLALALALIFSRGAAAQNQHFIYLPAVTRDPMPGDPIQVIQVRAFCDDMAFDIALDRIHTGSVYPVMIYAWDEWPKFASADRVSVNGVGYTFFRELSGLSNADIEALTKSDYTNVYVWKYDKSTNISTVRQYIR